MFDFTKITETLSGLAGNNDAAQQGGPLQEMIQAAGLDPDMLQGRGPQEILGLLSEHGIDPSQFTPDQISELAQSAGIPQSITDFASSWFGGNRST